MGFVVDKVLIGLFFRIGPFGDFGPGNEMVDSGPVQKILLLQNVHQQRTFPSQIEDVPLEKSTLA